MKMTKKLFVFLLVYTMAFYPLLGSLANAGSNKSEVMSQESGVEKQATVNESTKVKLQETYGKLPLSFIQNNGQVDEKMKYYEKGSGRTTSFTKDGIYLTLQTQNSRLKNKNLKSEISNLNSKSELSNLQSEIVKLIPLNANKNPDIIAEGKQEGKVNYFIGNDPKKWKTNVPTYNAVVYREIYKNIDMKFYGNNKQMEYDIIVKPGADPNVVKLSYEGIEGLKVTDDGDLLISLKQGDIVQKKPYIYQEINGKRIEVDGRFEILSQSQDPSLQPPVAYGFQVASYNKNHPLIIDPVLVYSTYLGGSGCEDGYDIAVDTSGNAYVTGITYSTDFPVVNPIQGSFAGYYDAFVSKLNSSGTALVYSTYLGGSNYYDSGQGIAVDTSGNAYVTGGTDSTNFPLVNPIQGSLAGSGDAFVTKLNTSGTALVYSTYLGGSGGEIGSGIAVDSSGNVYVTGTTSSTNFPLVSPIQRRCGGCSSGNDAFVTEVNASGTGLVYSTYLGGNGDDHSGGIATDAFGNAYITGVTNSSNFPTASPFDGSYNGGVSDVFVTKIGSRKK